MNPLVIIFLSGFALGISFALAGVWVYRQALEQTEGAVIRERVSPKTLDRLQRSM
jgi:hypothetical protein